MRAETRRGNEVLAVGLVVGTLYLAVVSDRFQLERGFGGLTLLFGSAFITALLWVMLALRSLAEDKPMGPEIDDGLMATAATTWVLALLPARESNFLSEGATDDFTWVDVPLSLFAVFAMLAAQKLWNARSLPGLMRRFFATTSATALFLIPCVLWGARGPGSERYALHAGLVAALGIVGALVSRSPNSEAQRAG